MANDDVRRLSRAALRRELARLTGEHGALTAALGRITPAVAKQRGARIGRRMDFGIGLFCTVAGFATMSVTMPIIGIAGVFGGALGLYRAGFAAFRGAAADDALGAELDRIRDDMATNRARADAIISELAARA